MYRLALSALLLPVAGIAGDPFECVDPDFYEAFVVGRSSTPPAFSTTVPDHVESLDLPLNIKLIGSQTQSTGTTVVYKIDQQADAAFSAIASALSKEGWIDVSEAHQTAMRGFQSARTPRSATFCRDSDPAHLSVYARDKSGQTYAFIFQFSQRELHGCSGNARSHRLTDRRKVMVHLPRLSLPEGATSSNFGTGGIGADVSTLVDVSDSMSRKDLLGYFGDQIKAQGWALQTNWSSDWSSGSVWMLDSPESGILIGTLQVFDSGADPVRVQFSINRTDAKSDADNGGWSIHD